MITLHDILLLLTQNVNQPSVECIHSMASIHQTLWELFIWGHLKQKICILICYHKGCSSLQSHHNPYTLHSFQSIHGLLIHPHG